MARSLAPAHVRVLLVRERSPLGTAADGALRVTGPADIYAAFNALHPAEPVEVFIAFFLNTRHRMLGHALISRGTIDATLISPREVLTAALLANATAIIVAHNHPSGDPSPTPDDRAVTTQLVQACRLMGIPLLDHIVIGDGSFSSIAEEGGI